MSARRGRQIRRVLVALDASPGSLAAAAAAARLAAILGAELAGLFVEDQSLLDLGGSPKASQVGMLTASAEPVGTEQIERQLRAQAARARHALARLASREGVGHTFSVARGRVDLEILAAAGRHDLVSIGRIGWSHRRRRLLGATARALLERRRSHTLLIDRGASLRAPVVVLCDGGEAANDAVRLAARLADPAAGRLVVLVTDGAAAQRATELLGAAAEQTRLLRLEGPLPETLRRRLAELRPGLLVLPLGGAAATADELADLAADLPCPLLAVS